MDYQNKARNFKKKDKKWKENFYHKRTNYNDENAEKSSNAPQFKEYNSTINQSGYPENQKSY